MPQMSKGIDVSENNGDVNWAAVAQAGFRERIVFVCACHPECGAAVMLTTAEYARRRPGPILAEGHG
jgi:GH25 family lysozyme M1 (1,4-beta-N-acetylmuramidase)